MRLSSETNPDEAMEIELNRAIESVICDSSADAVLKALYTDQVLVGEMQEVASLVPEEQIACVKMLDSAIHGALQRVVYSLACLKKVKGDNGWIHFNIVKALNDLLNDGVLGARQPCLIHCLLANQAFGKEQWATAYTQTIATRELLKLSPRDAAVNGILAATKGSSKAFEDVKRSAAALGVYPDTEVQFVAISQIASRLAIDSASSVFIDDSSAKATEKLLFVEEEEFRYPDVRGDGEHYIFKQAGEVRTLPRIDILEFKNGTISIDVMNLGLTQIYFFDKDGVCLTDLSHGFNPFIDDDCEVFDGDLCVLDDLFAGSFNICHFFLDKLTRVAVYSGLNLRDCKFLLSDDFPYYRDVFSAAGYGDKVIFPSKKRFSMKASRLFVSSNIKPSFVHPAHLCSPWAIKYLKSLFTRRDENSSLPFKRRKILISRADSSGRQVLNWDEFSQVLAERGFEVVVLAEMDFRAQVELFEAAQIVVGVHGAGLTNVLFAPSDCKVIEIVPPLVATQAYWLLASSLGLQYHAIIADDPDGNRPNYETWFHNADYNLRDVIVPLDRLLALL